MINAKNKNKIKKTQFLTVSWLSGLLSAQVNGAGGSRCQHWSREKKLISAVKVSGGFPGNVSTTYNQPSLIP